TSAQGEADAAAGVRKSARQHAAAARSRGRFSHRVTIIRNPYTLRNALSLPAAREDVNQFNFVQHEVRSTRGRRTRFRSTNHLRQLISECYLSGRSKDEPSGMSQSKEPRIYLSPPHMSGRELELVTEAFDSN